MAWLTVWVAESARSILDTVSWASPEDALDSAAAAYHRSRWDEQDSVVLLVSEKEAILGAIAPVTSDLDVPVGLLRGYSSETLNFKLAQYLDARPDKPVHIIDVGDHDASGVHSWYFLQDRLTGSHVTLRNGDRVDAGEDLGEALVPGRDITWTRIAVTEAQIADQALATRENKEKDPRHKGFLSEFGRDAKAVEVDAIRPSVLRELVTSAIVPHIDQEAWDATEAAETRESGQLEAVAHTARLLRETENDDDADES
jgi:hypothetical protein